MKKYCRIILCWGLIFCFFVAPFILWQYNRYQVLNCPEEITFIDFLNIKLIIILDMGLLKNPEYYEIFDLEKNDKKGYEVKTGVMYGPLYGGGGIFRIIKVGLFWKIVRRGGWMS